MTFDGSSEQATTHRFPVVGIGASAGGLQAFRTLLDSMPAHPGVAIVFLLHQEKHESVLVEVLRRHSAMPVETAQDGMVLQPDHVYVAPPETAITIVEGKLHVSSDGERVSMAIDALFRSLATDRETAAVGIVLSGALSDGALGLKAIKAEGGITFAQDDSALFDGMPRSAIAAGAVDFVLPPREIARELLRVTHHSYVRADDTGRLPEKELNRIFRLLQTAHGVDFSLYKPSTVERRIRRRLALHKLESLEEYVQMLTADPVEVEHLYTDILIRVTSFFRDPEVYEALQREIFPELMRERPGENPLRVWVPGCATGEEVYSLAICLLELAGNAGYSCPVQIFGTDINDAAVEQARVGVFPESIVADVSPERLRRYFVKVESGYRVTKAVRDCCVFARQNLTKDPPFSRLDLISCRNVMIYLGTMLQRKVMSIFHYALRTDGYLLLGSSETIGNFNDLFGTIDRKHKVYRKKATQTRVTVDFDMTPPADRSEVQGRAAAEELVSPTQIFREADRLLLSRYAPAGVLINDDFDILQFRGRTSPYLEPPAGTATFNILKMAREGLLPELRAAIHTARKSGEPVRRAEIRFVNDAGPAMVNLEIIPIVTPARLRYQLVLFEDVVTPVQAESRKKGRRKTSGEESEDAGQVARLRRELETTREYLQSIIEEQEAMNEELRSANEEIQSSNEELQSTNEELETAKEELQSSNEELTTLNEELENRHQDLAEANNDLLNLLGSIDIPILMLDSALRIRRFTPGAQRTFSLIPSDIGRPINDLKLTLQVDDLDQMIAEVIDNLAVKELEVQNRSGHWFLLRIRPYKTMENKIEGAVLVLVDIHQLKEARLREAAE
ncbi:MAG TPA: chemotaxis protein CheB [Thermoanaerobaculia bacterium]